jgi:hypothetical protein
MYLYIQNGSGGKVIILRGHSIDHSKQTNVCIHVSYSERFPRHGCFAVQYTVHCTDEQNAVSSHELQSALMLRVNFPKIYYAR